MRFWVESQRLPGERFSKHPFPKRTLKEAKLVAKATPSSQVRVVKIHKNKRLAVYPCS
jgi:hypothetical protein